MSKRPWMPFYVADYLADTIHLSTVEHGAYILLLLHYWQRGKLPENNDQLARICRLSVSKFVKIKPVLENFFDDSWVHKRVETELKKTAEISQKRSDAAMQMHKNKPAKAMQMHTHSHSHSHTQKDIDILFDRFWNIVPRKIAKGGAKKAFTTALKKTDIETILEGMKRYAGETTGRSPEYIKHPATWLNQECWADEPGGNKTSESPGDIHGGGKSIRGKQGHCSFAEAAGEVLRDLEQKHGGFDGEGVCSGGGQDGGGEIIEIQLAAGGTENLNSGTNKTCRENGTKRTKPHGLKAKNYSICRGIIEHSDGYGDPCPENVATKIKVVPGVV